MELESMELLLYPKPLSPMCCILYPKPLSPMCCILYPQCIVYLLTPKNVSIVYGLFEVIICIL